jgi:hypothetical protein
MPVVLDALRRLVNIDACPVVSLDADGVMVELDPALLTAHYLAGAGS